MKVMTRWLVPWWLAVSKGKRRGLECNFGCAAQTAAQTSGSDALVRLSVEEVRDPAQPVCHHSTMQYHQAYKRFAIR